MASAQKMAPKDVLVLCLDVGLGMQLSPPGERSHLERSIEILTKIIQRKIFAQSKDEIALVLFGCEETNNNLAEEDSYKNISVVFPLGLSNFDILEFVNNSLKPGIEETDFLDAITVCLDLLYNETKNKKINCRRIVLFTNFNHCSSDDNCDGIINGFLVDNMNVELTVIGPTIQINDDISIKEQENELNNNFDQDESNQPGPSSRMETLVCTSKDEDKIDAVTGKMKSENQLAGESTIKRIIQSGVAGACYSYNSADQAVLGFEKRSVKSAAWKCDLTLGNNLSIPCVAYAKTKEAKLKQSWKKCHAKTHKEEDVVKNQYYHRNDDDQTEVSKENVGKGYRYGKDIIPFGIEDEKQMKYLTDKKCLNVLGFTKQKNVPPSIHMDDQAHYVLPEASNAAPSLYALISAMHKEQLCAIACYVYRKGSNPKLVALLPRVQTDYKCLVMIALPFSEDVKPLAFPSLNNNSAAEVNAQQLSAVDKLIDEMDLSNEDLLEPKEMLNPFFQNMYHCLNHRFVHAHGNIPQNADCTIFSLPVNVQEKADQSLDKIKSLFQLKSLSNESTSLNRWKTYETIKVGNEKIDNDIATNDYQPLATITTSSVENIGTITPDQDFLSIIESNSNNTVLVEMAFKQLQERINDFLKDPFVINFSSKIVGGLKTLISKSEEHNQVDNTNHYLVNIKKKLLETSTSLWDILVKSDINLIGDNEYNGNNRSNFQCSVQPSSTDVYLEDTEQDAEDLLDMIE